MIFPNTPPYLAAYGLLKYLKEIDNQTFFFGHCVRNCIFGKPIYKYTIITSASLVYLKDFVKSRYNAYNLELQENTVFSGVLFNTQEDIEIIVYPFQSKRVWNSLAPDFGAVVELKKKYNLVGYPAISLARGNSLTASQQEYKVNGIPTILIEDALSRTFTLEAIYYDPINLTIYDPLNAITSIRQGQLKEVPLHIRSNGELASYSNNVRANPDSIVRSIAYSSYYNLIPTTHIDYTNEKNGDLGRLCSKQTYRKYMPYLLNSCALDSLNHYGLLEPLFGDLAYADMSFFSPKKEESLYDHICLCLDRINELKLKDSVALRMATILCEVSYISEGRVNLYQRSAYKAKEILTNLGYEDKFKERVFKLIFGLQYAFSWTYFSEDEKLEALESLKDCLEDVWRLAYIKLRVSKINNNNSPGLMKIYYKTVKDMLSQPPLIDVSKLLNNYKIPSSTNVKTVVNQVRKLQIKNKVSSKTLDFHLMREYGIERLSCLLR